MPKYKYGRNGQRTFTLLIPKNNQNYIDLTAKLDYIHSATINYKESNGGSMKLGVSCDRGPELWEGEELIATEIHSSNPKKFRIKKLLMHNEGWYLILKHEVFNNSSEEDSDRDLSI